MASSEPARNRKPNEQSKPSVFMVIVKATKELRSGRDAEPEAAGRDGQVQRRAGEGRDHAGRRRPAPELQGQARAFSGEKRTVIDGPFAETKELIAGYWMWQVQSMEEAVEWVKRCPNPMHGRIRDRDPPGVRGRGFRRGVHARAARAGRASPRRGGKAFQVLTAIQQPCRSAFKWALAARHFRAIIELVPARHSHEALVIHVPAPAGWPHHDRRRSVECRDFEICLILISRSERTSKSKRH